MKTAFAICFVFALVFWTNHVLAQESAKPWPSGGQLVACDSNTTTYRYLLLLPAEYGQKKQQWPVILRLHGADRRGNDLKKLEKNDLLKPSVKDGNFPFIIVCPQCPDDQRWSSELLIDFLDNIATRYNIDANRIYVTGPSMGGRGTWDLACDYPERFAAIAPICGAGRPKDACRLKNIPVWAFHGAEDEVVPLEESQTMVNAIKACGGNARLTVYPKMNHAGPDANGNTVKTLTYANKELYDWFLKHTKTKGTQP